LIVRRDDLKRDLRRILLLFVSDDDLKRDLRQILLLFVFLLESCWANGRRNLFFGAGPEKPNFFCHRNALAHISSIFAGG